ncbi:hypothetical protein AVEN_146464-1 [Araneus ventricosus]|uniref:Uncharacterized protein n=1 Tax=Araneus ventricosus TaxID=182803 RepID=A0A4Y2REQ6_ARAVE|nr:hypothetical protein AVEN_146464-1 [Araneus ventricosus]
MGPDYNAVDFVFLEEYFYNRVIAVNYSIFTSTGMDWPPNSPDLKRCDYFLYGTLQDTVFQNNTTILYEFEEMYDASDRWRWYKRLRWKHANETVIRTPNPQLQQVNMDAECEG